MRREQEHLATLRSLAFTEGVAEAIEEHDATRLERLVLPVAVNAGAPVVEVLDRQGNRIYRAARAAGDGLRYESVTEPVERAPWPLAQQALTPQPEGAPDKFAALVVDGTVPTLAIAGPVLLDGDIVGAVVVASPLASLLPAVKSEALADISVFAPNGSLLASTFALDGAAGSSPPPPGAEGSLAEDDLFGREYAFLSAPLRLRETPVGTYSVALPTSFITSANNLTRSQLGILFSVATLAVLATGWLLSRALTAPLLRLARAARAVSEGDLTARSGVSGRDEIGALADTFDTMTAWVQRQHLGTIGALVSAIDARDPYTRGHSLRVGHLSMEIGRALGLSDSQLQHLQVGGYLHDVGKIGVRDSVLLKAGALSPEERAHIEEHPRIGLDILSTVELPPEVRAIVGGHHERLDGTGYPLHLAAEELTAFPRIAAVADVYDALVTDRPYKAGMTAAEALRILRRESLAGGLDAEVVSTMERLATRWEERRRRPRPPGLRPPGRPLPQV
ncbi:MAG: HAMP domain-containing protein [Dehalococcoidia bacterium]|nr:HAMP domain-containing protein [Dehalococcoidia bacterium]